MKNDVALCHIKCQVQHVLARPDWGAPLEQSIRLPHLVEVDVVVAHVFWQVEVRLEVQGDMISSKTRVGLAVWSRISLIDQGVLDGILKVVELELVLHVILANKHRTVQVDLLCVGDVYFDFIGIILFILVLERASGKLASLFDVEGLVLG